MSGDSPHSQNSTRRSMTLRSPQERKQVLRYGLAKAQNLQDNINKDTLQLLEEVMEEVDSINLETSLDEKINNQDEVLLDSATMNVSSKVLKAYSKSLTKNMSSYSGATYADRLVKYIKHLPNTVTEDTHWPLLEPDLVKCFMRTPSWNTSLFGSLVPLEKKETVSKRKITKEKQVPIKRPENIITVSKEEESVEETVDKIRKIIIDHYKTSKQPVDFFKLVLHPTDFSKTVENMLHVSFLIRDRAVEIKKDNYGVLVVYPCTKETIAQSQSNEKNIRIQNAMSFSMNQWKDLLDAYQIEKPMVNVINEKRTK